MNDEDARRLPDGDAGDAAARACGRRRGRGRDRARLPILRPARGRAGDPPRRRARARGRDAHGALPRDARRDARARRRAARPHDVRLDLRRLRLGNARARRPLRRRIVADRSRPPRRRAAGGSPGAARRPDVHRRAPAACSRRDGRLAVPRHGDGHDRRARRARPHARAARRAHSRADGGAALRRLRYLDRRARARRGRARGRRRRRLRRRCCCRARRGRAGRARGRPARGPRPIVSGSAVVAGAGVTGAAVARALAARGWRVTLVEQYAPGTVRSASGGDTRLLRAAHGEADWYTELAWRARSGWLELQEETGTRIWEPVGLAWFARRAEGFEARSVASLERHGVPFDWLTPDDARTLYPTLTVDDLHAVLFEPDAGVLHEARRLTPEEQPKADVVVWACGAWLPALFPALVPVVVERRDVFFLGADAGWTGTPGFVDYDAGFYGHGDVAGLGVKVAPDVPSDPVDPDTLDGIALPSRLQDARNYV